MIVFPNCKINLGLQILGKREDNYHNIETIFFPLPLHDVLEIITSPGFQARPELILSGNKIDGPIEKNLCLKAYHLLKKDFPQLPAIKIYLHKVIPSGAGLGGGSADGAFMLKLLNDKFQLGLSVKHLMQYALQLGSDCPFFIVNTPCFAQKRGEDFEPVHLSLPGYKFVLINPGIHINTSWAFQQVGYSTSKNLKDIISSPVDKWKGSLVNDFETPVFKAFPEIENIKTNLYLSGAVYAGLSGSGSTVFGIFHPGAAINYSSLPGNYFKKEINL